jgi:hypothetical protein
MSKSKKKASKAKANRKPEVNSPQKGESRAAPVPVAYHEAGHATIAAMLGILRSDSTITIIPEKNGFLTKYGSVTVSKEMGIHDSGKRWSARYVRKLIVATYAGPAVSKKLHPNLDLLEEGGDCELDMLNATDLKGRFLVPPDCDWSFEFASLYPKERTWKEAVALVELNWPAIQAVAAELLERRTMTGAEVKATLRLRNQRRRSENEGSH